MSKNIRGAEHPLVKIFSQDFEYAIPPYQRPYAWTTEHASELFDDLYDFFKSEPDEDYFLGSIVLIKEESKPSSEVVDGQQRLTTLTILIASLASLLEENSKKRNELLELIKQPEKGYQDIAAKPRLTLRARDNNFFTTYVQEINFNGLVSLDEKNLENESQVNIKNNSKLFIDKINEKFSDDEKERDAFIRFLLNRCYLVTVSTPNQTSAFRIFSVMNSRGLDLQATDILKAEIIGKFSKSDEEKYSAEWEGMEVELGRDDFNNLFSYIRMIYAKEKAKRSLLEEFRSKVIGIVSDPQKMIDKILKPYAKALLIVRGSCYEATSHAEDVNANLRWLNRINNSDWIPVAVRILYVEKSNSEYISLFFQKLERLAAYLHLCGFNVNSRITRYSKILEALKNHSTGSLPKDIELSEQEKENMREVLNGNIYELTSERKKYAILRLDDFISDGGASYDTNVLTIEHVLPQTVGEDTEWTDLWPNEKEREKWVHRIGNLVPLNKSRNSQAMNYNFEKKKSAYFSGYNNASSYALTTQVLKCSEWTPEQVERRQRELMKVFHENWDL